MPAGYTSTAAAAHGAAISACVLVGVFYCFILFRASDSFWSRSLRFSRGLLPLEGRGDGLPRDEHTLDRILMDASMPDNTVILTTMNEAWAAPDSVLDLFLESFRIGEGTRHLLNHLVIISLDRGAFSRCTALHSHCFPLITEGVDFSREAYFMTPGYLKMMWRRIDFLRSVLAMGYNFVFTDADVMWFRDPFPNFHPDADFQIACDHFSGGAEDTRNVPNGGFSFVRSNERSMEFYNFWYSSRNTYPGLHDQDVLSRIKNSSFIRNGGIKMRFLDTDLFGGFCEPSRNLSRVCTMHANCCLGLSSKLNDLRLLLEDWKRYSSLPERLKPLSPPSWSVPQNCSIKSLFHDEDESDFLDEEEEEEEEEGEDHYYSI